MSEPNEVTQASLDTSCFILLLDIANSVRKDDATKALGSLERRIVAKPVVLGRLVRLGLPRTFASCLSRFGDGNNNDAVAVCSGIVEHLCTPSSTNPGATNFAVGLAPHLGEFIDVCGRCRDKSLFQAIKKIVTHQEAMGLVPPLVKEKFKKLSDTMDSVPQPNVRPQDDRHLLDAPRPRDASPPPPPRTLISPKLFSLFRTIDPTIATCIFLQMRLSVVLRTQDPTIATCKF
jgi:hypothetical protein